MVFRPNVFNSNPLNVPTFRFTAVKHRVYHIFSSRLALNKTLIFSQGFHMRVKISDSYFSVATLIDYLYNGDTACSV
jgi:hypothetical protein